MIERSRSNCVLTLSQTASLEVKKGFFWGIPLLTTALHSHVSPHGQYFFLSFFRRLLSLFVVIFFIFCWIFKKKKGLFVKLYLSLWDKHSSPCPSLSSHEKHFSPFSTERNFSCLWKRLDFGASSETMKNMVLALGKSSIVPGRHLKTF